MSLRRAFHIVLSSLLAASAIVPAAHAASVAFVRVHVLPMDSERVLRDQTVIVEDGRIRAIGPNLRVPDDAQVIDGAGQAWLSPGLADMHTHSDSRQDMAVYLAHGVTTLLHMGEAPTAFAVKTRAALERGELPGPHVYAAFMVDGSNRYGHLAVRGAAQARAVAELARANGFDFIKVYNDLDAPAFDALIAAGNDGGLKVIGHGLSAVGLERQIAAGQAAVAHAEEFFYSWLFRPGDDDGIAVPDPARIDAVVAALKRHGTYATADLATYAAVASQWGRAGATEAYLKQTQAGWLAPEERLEWRRRGDAYAARTGTLAPRLAFLQRLVAAMAAADLPLMTGTDAPVVPGMFPGSALHAQLAALEAAGVSRYRALRAATRTPGDFIAQHRPGGDRFGRIAPGYRADLLLSATDPLDDLATLAQPLGVMAQGRWYPRARLRELTVQVADEYSNACARPQ
ncbi:amidohydrolase family protein [Lysobacter enzymogenes]|uniref:amidohydrolase family protein n=1 Tax=Lysobacter enzymogenes TaxID=69 RepID=UPI001AF48309|nr:amidohydrolase family protein [Lysobacter enzymogenes]QQQ01915.1 amidohydrolase family protein [Lysobacter enzymogenes]